MFSFLSKPWNSEALNEPLDAIVVLSNWYDRISKVRKVLELAEPWISETQTFRPICFRIFRLRVRCVE